MQKGNNFIIAIRIVTMAATSGGTSPHATIADPSPRNKFADACLVLHECKIFATFRLLYRPEK